MIAIVYADKNTVLRTWFLCVDCPDELVNGLEIQFQDNFSGVLRGGFQVMRMLPKGRRG